MPEAHDVAAGLAILSSLEVIWDQWTAERRREFAELLFSRVTVDQHSRTRAWALNNPFHRLFEFAQPGSKLVLDGDPNRTSFELQLNSDAAIWLSAARLADALRTIDGRSADARGSGSVSGVDH
jgi:hypothetical protein